jgi:hypothetical protein
MSNLGRDQEPDDCFFAKSLAGFEPVQSLDENEAVFVGPNDNGSLLSDFQNTFRDFLNELRLESFLSLHGNVNLGDWEAFRFGHSLYSVATEPHPNHLALVAGFYG